MKKKLLAMLLCAALTLGLAACTAPAPTQSPSSAPGADTLYKAGTYTGTGEGKNGPIEVKVTFTAVAIEKVEIGSHTEMAGPVFEQYPAAIVDGQTLAVDTIAGATIPATRCWPPWLTLLSRPVATPPHCRKLQAVPMPLRSRLSLPLMWWW